MIEEISIRNLGVIGEARLPLGPGFTALTGETGAGKTMVVTALGLLLGERADAAVVRQGSTGVDVEGRWLVPESGPVVDRVRDAGGDVDPDGSGSAELLLGRSINPEGRSRATVGGRSAPIGVLAELGEQLVVVHGQSDQVRLRSAGAQRAALDRFAGPELAETLQQYQREYTRWSTARTELETLLTEQDRRRTEAAELRAAIEEIEAVAPQPGEDETLAQQAERLANVEDLRLAAAHAHELISSESLDDASDVLGLLDGARRQLERVADHDPALAPISQAVAELGFVAADLAGQLASYLSSLDTDGGQELGALQERRAALATIARKYGPTLDEAIAFLDSGSARLLELDTDTDRIAQLEAEVAEAETRVAELAEQLIEQRTRHASLLAEQVTAELAALAMPDASLHVQVERRDTFTTTGADQVAILLRPHPGAEPRPLGRGASGGELSRVMLAIEVVIAGSDPVPTFIFDEVDAGVGGAAAIEIGRRLARLAETAQVIVVTHLAQVAAFAGNHLRVVKGGDGTVTASSVQQLHGAEREAEMARLLSGLTDSASGLEHARELLSLSQP